MQTQQCPICGKKLPEPTESASTLAPFCSDRCRSIDLGKWFSDSYIIPGQESLTENDMPDENE